MADKNNRHELRKELKLLKIQNMKMKKQLRLAMRVRFLNRSRLEEEITDLNNILYHLKTKFLASTSENLNEDIKQNFKNPKSSSNIESSNEAENNCEDVNNDENKDIIYKPPKKSPKSKNFKFFCDRCEFKSFKKTAFDIHIRRHEGIKPFQCDMCKKSFTTNSEMQLHKSIHLKYQTCEKCQKTNQYVHIITNENVDELLVKGYRCKNCGHKNNEKSELLVPKKITVTKNRKNKITKSNDPNENTKGKLIVDNLRRLGNDIWICDYCKIVFKQKKVLVKHIRTHTGERPFSCDQCEYAAASKSTLIIHKRKHTGEKPYTCNYCPFKCATKGYLNIHLNKHFGLKPFACNQCDYRSIDSCKLSTHVKIHHSDVKPFACNTCPFRTKLKSRLKKHMIIHGSRPLVCHFCAKTFTVKKALQEHEGIHTGNQPYRCKFCKVEKKFTLEITYKNHMARHLNKNNCKMCDYKTDRKMSYIRHLESHLKGPYYPRKRFDKCYRCKICNYNCSQLSKLNRHMEIRHPSQPFTQTEVQEKTQHQQVPANPVVLNEPRINIPTLSLATTSYNPLILNIPNAQPVQMDTAYQEQSFPYPLTVNYVVPLPAAHMAPTIPNLIDLRNVTQPPVTTFIYSCDQCEYKVTDYNELTLHKNTAHLKETDYTNYFRDTLH